MKRILLIDDERKMRRVLQIMVEGLGFESVPAEHAEEALEHLGRQSFDLILTDFQLPGMDGLAFLRRLREVDADTPVIVLTAYGTVETAVEAIKLGALDFILKPFAVETLERLIRRALELRQVRRDNLLLREQLAPSPPSAGLIGVSGAMATVFDLIHQVAPTRASVLITGETGTGKELVARAIHDLSPRASRPLVALNCAAIPAELLESELFGHTRGAFTGASSDRIGKFELADGGSLLLDEIGDMPQAMQAKLLRVLQDGVIERIGSNKRVSVDVRVLAATNKDLAAAAQAGHFRQDLYYRLNVFEIALPPLRERREDILPLARHFCDHFARELGRGPLVLADDAARVLAAHDWPGNVRELRNLVERAAVLAGGPRIDATAFGSIPLATSRVAQSSRPDPGGDVSDFRLDPAVEELERRLILRALQATGDNKVQAARLLGVSERTLWYKLKRYRL